MESVIFEELQPALQQLSQDRKVPLRGIANGLIYRSLLCESLSDKVIAKLPHSMNRPLADGSYGIQGIRDRSEYVPASSMMGLDADLPPYVNQPEIEHWYVASIHGIGKAMALEKAVMRAATSPDRPWTEGDRWLYDTGGLMLSQIYHRALACNETRLESGLALGMNANFYGGW